MKKLLSILFCASLFFFLPLFIVRPVYAALPGDINGDNKVDVLDLRQLLQNFTSLSTSLGTGVFNYNLMVGNYGKTETGEWTQLAHDAQRTGYTSEEPNTSKIAYPDTNWSFAWHWKPNDFTTIPRGAHAVTGGLYVYMPAGSKGLYAISKSTGITAWTVAGNFADAPAYDPSTGYLFAGSADGNLYKINASGQKIGTYTSGAVINQAVLLVGSYAYITNQNGELHKVNTANMTQVWKYTATNNSPATTAPSYSSSRQLIIFGTEDLNVHAVNDSNGSQKWRVNPPLQQYNYTFPTGDCYPYSYQYGWPVVADNEGVVLVRIRLGDQHDWFGSTGPNGRFPTTNAGIKTFLEQNPRAQPLYALKLVDGSKAFTPAAGNGGIDDDPPFVWCPGAPDNYGGMVSTIGPMPAIKTLTNGKQVAYIIFRNGDVEYDGWDARGDGHMGEMVLDNQTITNYTAGDIRFVKWQGSHTYPLYYGVDAFIIDEMSPVTVAGNTIFYSHWSTVMANTITDRADGKGLTRTNPITTIHDPFIIRRINDTYNSQDPTTPHWGTYGTLIYCDGRNYNDQQAWWVYRNEIDPPLASVPCDTMIRGYGDGMRPRYTFVSDGKIYVVGNGGDIFALTHN